MSNHEAWLGAAHPKWSPFAPPVAASCHDHDLVAVSLEGGVPERVTCSRFAALLRDGKSDGSVQVGEPDGTVATASFAQLRSYIYGAARF